MKESAAASIPGPEKPAVVGNERVARLESLAQRLLDPEGLDRAALSQIERLTVDDQ